MRRIGSVSAVLGARALNRATLARQLLLERADLAPLDAVRHLVGLQSQVPHNPYTALWSRLAGFRPESLSAAARAARGRADRRHARDDSPAHGRRLPRAPPGDPAGLRRAALAPSRLLAAAARRRSGSGRRGRPARARGAADGNRAASVPRGAISEARRGSARLRLPDAARARAGAAARPLGEERPGSVDDGGGVARAAARRRRRRSTTWCCATSPRSGLRRWRT